MVSSEVNFGFFIAGTMFLAGFLTYLYRDKPNYAIGVRVGYTLQSREAWRRANEFAGRAFMALGFVLAILSFTGNIALLTGVMLVGVIIITWKSIAIAREMVELEDLSTPAKGEPKPLTRVNIKPYLTVQLILIFSYLLLLAVSWKRLPETVAVHFNERGVPDRFEPKSLGTFLMPMGVFLLILGLTYLGRDPVVLRIPKGNLKVARILLELLTVAQLIIWGALVYSILYNAYSFSSPVILEAIVIGTLGLIIIQTSRLILAVKTGNT